MTDPTGTYSFTVQAVNAGPPIATVTQALTLKINPWFTDTTPNNLPGGTEGTAYTTNISATGGIAPYTFQYLPGPGSQTPPGLGVVTLNATTAQLTGTPTTAGNYQFSVQASDSSAPPQVYFITFFVTILPQPPTSLTGTNGGNFNTFLNWTASTAADVAGYRVHRGTSPGTYTTTINLSSPVTSYNDQGLTSGTYYYVVTTVSTSGVESVFSNQVQVIIP